MIKMPPRKKGGFYYSRGYRVLLLDGCEEEREHRSIVEEAIGRKLLRNELVHHIDGNRENNHLGNLLVVSRSQHATMHWDDKGHRDLVRSKLVGSKSPAAKLWEGHIPKIRERIANGEPLNRIARDYGVSVTTISLIKHGKSWTHC